MNENRNLKKIKMKNNNGEEIEKTVLKIAFENTMFQGKMYCKKKGLDLATFNKVLVGKLTGQKSSPRGGNARKVILQLKADGIWVGKLTWEV